MEPFPAYNTSLFLISSEVSPRKWKKKTQITQETLCKLHLSCQIRVETMIVSFTRQMKSTYQFVSTLIASKGETAKDGSL